MPANKNQHLVPRFLLSRFCRPGEELVRLYSISRDQIIPAAPIKYQASEDYFYGKDPEFEQMLGFIEGDFAPLIPQLESRLQALPAGAHEQIVSSAFMAAQTSRTQAAADEANAQLDGVRRHTLDRLMVAKGHATQGELDAMKLVHTEPGRYTTQMGISLMPFLFDLNVRILKPNGDARFILGDNPAILVNPAYTGRGLPSSTGIAMRGLVALCPLSPTRLLFMFDRSLYKVGARSEVFQVGISDDDVSTVNRLQAATSLSTVFLPPDLPEGVFRADWRAAIPFRVITRAQVEGHRIVGVGTLVQTRREDLRVPLKWSFISVRKQYRGAQLPPFNPRDPELCKAQEHFVRNGNPTLRDIRDFFAFAIQRAVGSAKPPS